MMAVPNGFGDDTTSEEPQASALDLARYPADSNERDAYFCRAYEQAHAFLWPKLQDKFWGRRTIFR